MLQTLPTIEMDQEAAAAKAMEYAAAVAAGKYPDTKEGRRQRSIDLAAVRGFEAMAEGRKVINVHTALSHAGLDNEGLPRLAIARADAPRVSYRWEASDSVARFTASFPRWSGKRKATDLSFTKLSWNPNVAKMSFGAPPYRTYLAIVPTIPPQHRPPSYQLHKFHILWEADWHRAPADPFLLLHLQGDLYTIEAHWDLTDLERGLLEHAIVQR